MANVVVEKNRYTVESLYQWDINQTLIISGLSLPSVPEIHFTNDAMDRAIVRQSTMDAAGVVSVDVPNSLLQKPYKIKAYVCIYEGDEFRSLYEIVIPVKARNKPNDYTFVDNVGEVYSFNALENKVENALLISSQQYAEALANLNEAKAKYEAAISNYESLAAAYEESLAEFEATVTRLEASVGNAEASATNAATAASEAQTAANNAETAANNAATSAANATTVADEAKAAAEAAQTTADGKAPKSHASTATTYGAGTGSNYGHVKLSDSTSSTSGASAGIAATPAAVKSAYDLANKALPKAGGTLTGNLILTENVHYGTSLPSTATKGRIFFLKA